MSDNKDDEYLNYVNQLRNTLEVASAEPEEQCDAMGAYNAPWELKTGGCDFIDACLSLQRGQLDAATVARLIELRSALQQLPEEAVTPTGEVMTTFKGCLVAFRHPAWIPIRASARDLMWSIPDPFAGP